MLDTGLGVQETAVNGRGHPPSRWEQTANKSTANHDSEGKERMMLRKGTGKEATPELTGGCSELPQKVLETPRSLRSFTVVSKSGPPTRLLLHRNSLSSECLFRVSQLFFLQWAYTTGISKRFLGTQPKWPGTYRTGSQT